MKLFGLISYVSSAPTGLRGSTYRALTVRASASLGQWTMDKLGPDAESHGVVDAMRWAKPNQFSYCVRVRELAMPNNEEQVT